MTAFFFFRIQQCTAARCRAARKHPQEQAITDLRASEAPRWPQCDPKTAPRGPRDGSRWPQDVQRHSQMAQVGGSAEHFVIYDVIGTSGRCRERPRDTKMAPRGPRMAPRGPKMTPRWPQDALRWPQEAPRWPRSGKVEKGMAPRWPKMAPRWPQDGLKMAQDGPRMAQDSQKTAPRWPKIPQDIPSWPQVGPKMAQDVKVSVSPRREHHFSETWIPQVGPKLAPRWPQDANTTRCQYDKMPPEEPRETTKKSPSSP